MDNHHSKSIFLKERSRRRWLCSTALMIASSSLTVSGLQPTAFAQDAEDSAYHMNTVVVTARKREERLIDTPLAVSALSEKVIEDRNMADLTEVARLVPSMTFDRGTGSTGGSGNAQVFIRGVGQSDYLFTSDPGVGLYIDGVYFPRGTGIVMDMIDLQQVEVLRGPQGTLFGKNTIGGAINITTNQPSEDLEGRVRVTTGSRDRLDMDGVLNLPLIEDTLSLRLTGSSRQQDGYVERVLVGDTLGDINSLFGRAQLRWTPGSDLTVDLAMDITQKRESSIAEELVDMDAADPSNLLLGLWNGLVAPTYGTDVLIGRNYLTNDYETFATGNNYSDFDMFGVSANVDWEISPDVTLRSITAFREQDSQFAADNDHSPYQFIESNNDNEHEAFSQEVQLIGSSFSDKLDWVVGAFYMSESGSDVNDAYYVAGLYDILEFLPGAIIPLADGVACPSMFCAGGAGNPANASLDFEVLLTNEIDIESYALFGEASYEISDRWGMSFGFRYSHDTKDFVTSLLKKASGAIGVPETRQTESWEDISPRASLQYALSDSSNLYFSVTNGFKSGGFNGRALSSAEITVYDPEQVWSYEFGGKFADLGGVASLNAAVFYSDYEDMQLQSVRSVDGVVTVVTENAGAVEMAGAEIELFASPTESLNLQLSLGYLDATYANLSPGATVTEDDELVKAPEWTFSAAADYTIDLPEGRSLTLGGDVSYRSSYANELTNEPVLMQDGFALYGAYASLSLTDSLDLTLFGKNLSDERYMTNGIASYGSFGNVVANYSAPREWGIRLKYAH